MVAFSFGSVSLLSPASAIAYSGKGLALKYMQRYQEALQPYEQAIVCDPSYGLAWHNKGDVLLALWRTAETEQTYQSAREPGYQW